MLLNPSLSALYKSVGLRSRDLSYAFLYCLIFAACSEPNPKLIAVPPKPPADKVVDAGEKVIYNPAVDILFVIDDSGSMDPKQRNLAQNVDLFTDQIQKFSALDFHIGVVTSTMNSYGGRGDGKLYGIPSFVDKNTANFKATLARNLRPGVDGSGNEQFFSPIKAALTPPNVTGINAGFYRADAYLMIIFITDGEDLSMMTATDLYSLLLSMKNQQKEKIITNGVIISTQDSTCDRSGEIAPVKIEQFLKLSGGTQFGLCDIDYGQKLAALGKLLVERIGGAVYLKRAPIVSTIKVQFGTQKIESSAVDGWMFDSRRNAIVFAKGLKWSRQPSGTTIEVTFDAADSED